MKPAPDRAGFDISPVGLTGYTGASVPERAHLLKEEAGPLVTGRLLLLGRRCCYEVRREVEVCGPHLNEP